MHFSMKLVAFKTQFKPVQEEQGQLINRAVQTADRMVDLENRLQHGPWTH